MAKSLKQILLLFIVLPLCNESYNATTQKHFVIVIPSYNNSRWYERNVASVLSQNYGSFDVIYTDDCSPDGTGNLVEQYLQQNDSEH